MDLYDAHMTVGEGLHIGLDPNELIERMDSCGVSRAFIAPTERFIAVDNEEGNAYILGLIHDYPDRFMGYAVVNPWYGEKGHIQLRRALESGLQGIKLHPVLQGFSLFDDTIRPILQIAEQFHAIVYVHTGAPMNALPLQVAAIAADYPEVDFIMGRMGKTDYALDVIPALKQAPNVYAESAYCYPSYLRHLIDEVGVERLLFSTDTPLTFMDQEVTKFNDTPMSKKEKELIACGNLIRLTGRRTIDNENNKSASHPR